MCHIVVTEHSDALDVIIEQGENTRSDNFATRLRAERGKLRLTQRQMAEAGGVTLNTQHRYESGTLPPIDYLLRLGAAGADWYWIVTGERIDGTTLDEKSFELVEFFRRLTPPMQDAIVAHIRQLAEISEDGRGRLHESGRDYRPGPD